jgi:hypothetical protein
MNELEKPIHTHPAAGQLVGAEHEIESHATSTSRVNDRHQSPRRHLRLRPIAAIIAAADGLALIFEPENYRIDFVQQELTTVSPEEAVDISVCRLVCSRVIARLQKANHLNASPQRNRDTFDAELGRILDHPLYAMIRERMTDHLRSKGYDRVTIYAKLDPKDPTLSSDAEITLHRFIHSLRASFPAPNDKVAAFLDYHEDVFGSSIVRHLGAGRYDAALTLLIQLLFEFPDELKPFAGAVEVVPHDRRDIDQDFRGGSQAIPPADWRGHRGHSDVARKSRLLYKLKSLPTPMWRPSRDLSLIATGSVRESCHERERSRRAIRRPN